MTTHPGPKLYGIKFFTTKYAWDRCSRKELQTGNVFNLLWGEKKKKQKPWALWMLVILGS